MLLKSSPARPREPLQLALHLTLLPPASSLRPKVVDVDEPLPRHVVLCSGCEKRLSLQKSLVHEEAFSEVELRAHDGSKRVKTAYYCRACTDEIAGDAPPVGAASSAHAPPQAVA